MHQKKKMEKLKPLSWRVAHSKCLVRFHFPIDRTQSNCALLPPEFLLKSTTVRHDVSIGELLRPFFRQLLSLHPPVEWSAIGAGAIFSRRKQVFT